MFDQFGDKNKGLQRKHTKIEKKQIRRDELGPLARKAEELEHRRNLESFNRFNQHFVDAYMAERNVTRNPQVTKEKELQNPLDDFINMSTVQDFSETERLSKRLARMGVASRRMAEKLIS